ncbi:MAG TPA: toll/interleukin-1 receptor domain-containing protein [Planctomycetota bacterium]
MTTPREIWEKDSSRHLRAHRVDVLKDSQTGESVEAIASLVFDFDAGVQYISIFFESTPMAASLVRKYLEDPDHVLNVGKGVEIDSGYQGTDEKVRSSDLIFSKRFVIYTGYEFDSREKKSLSELAASRGLSLVLRDGRYIAARAAIEIPMAFIMHDSRDKEPFVRELANALQRMLCTVWYDEFSLLPGQSLRAGIENGLKTCRRCVLIMSPNFMANEGWTKAEFDSIYTREILEKKNIFIPVWHNVTKEQVYQYSPRLLDRVAVPSGLGVEAVARRVMVGIHHED